jgi:hypothetical protein
MASMSFASSIPPPVGEGKGDPELGQNGILPASCVAIWCIIIVVIIQVSGGMGICGW